MFVRLYCEFVADALRLIALAPRLQLIAAIGACSGSAHTVPCLLQALRGAGRCEGGGGASSDAAWASALAAGHYCAGLAGVGSGVYVRACVLACVYVCVRARAFFRVLFCVCACMFLCCMLFVGSVHACLAAFLSLKCDLEVDAIALT